MFLFALVFLFVVILYANYLHERMFVFFVDMLFCYGYVIVLF